MSENQGNEPDLENQGNEKDPENQGNEQDPGMSEEEMNSILAETSFVELKKQAREFHRDKKSGWLDCTKAILGLLKISVDYCIYKVPNELRKVNEDAHGPRIVSIGLFHYNEQNLLAMEQQKWQCVLSLLQRTPEAHLTLTRCVEAVESLESKARGSYAESFELDSHNLKEIMLVDGCFILELFLKFWPRGTENRSDPIFDNAWMIPTLRHDLLLLENQIPFFVLKELFDVVMPCIPIPAVINLPSSITELALSFFKSDLNQILKYDRGDPRHLLDLLHNFYIPKLPKKYPREREEARGFKKCATELLEAGIDIKKGTDPEARLLEIMFDKGALIIPPLCIYENTDSLLRSLIAFEQCCFGSTHHIASYAVLMRSLIRSSRDVAVLQRKGIITNGSISAIDVLTFFDSLLKEVVPKDFYFGRLCAKVNTYHKGWWRCSRLRLCWKVRYPKYIAALKDDYFANPWSITAFLAAALILSLTVAQTYYTVRSYYPH